MFSDFKCMYIWKRATLDYKCFLSMVEKNLEQKTDTVVFILQNLKLSVLKVVKDYWLHPVF